MRMQSLRWYLVMPGTTVTSMLACSSFAPPTAPTG